MSNALPAGNVYGTVSLGLLPDACTGEKDGVQIVVDANQNIFTTTGTNFGIQVFGFNYSGNPDELVITTSGNWKVKIDQNLSEFGIFMEDTYGTGSNRQDPLIVNICSNTSSDLMVGDFDVPNADGYIFVAHIADFTFQGYNGNSAWFSTTQDCSPLTTTTTTTVIPTTTTTVPETTTTTSIPTTTTTEQEITTTTTTEMPTTTTTVPEINVTTSIIIIPVTTTTTVEPTTLIELKEFKALLGNRAVTLTWVTESEIDNIGFNIYGAESEFGEYTKINAALIPARGAATSGAAYEFVDDGLQNRKTYYYTLEDIDLNGKSTTHGPISATPRFIFGIFNK